MSVKQIAYQEFLAGCEEDTRAEWVRGKVIHEMSPISVTHQAVTRFLLRLFSDVAEHHDLGAVFYESFQMKLLPSGREPDLVFVAKQNLVRLRENYLDGPADLVVEVVSPESQERDRVTKFHEYEQGGVGEYWLIDPALREARFYVRDSSGRFAPHFPDADGVYRSVMMPGLWIRTDWLWQTPLPPMASIRRQLGLA